MANVKIAPLAWSATGMPPPTGDPCVPRNLAKRLFGPCSQSPLWFMASTSKIDSLKSSMLMNEMSKLALSSMA